MFMEKFSTIYSKPNRSIPMVIGLGVIASAAGTGAITLFKAIHQKITNAKKEKTSPANMIMKFFHISGMSKEKKAFFVLITQWIYGPGLGLLRPLIPLTGRKGFAASSIRSIVIQLISTFLIPLIKNTSRNKFNIRDLFLLLIHHLFNALTIGLIVDGTMKGKAYNR